jgi:hypothetical protein
MGSNLTTRKYNKYDGLSAPKTFKQYPVDIFMISIKI